LIASPVQISLWISLAPVRVRGLVAFHLLEVGWFVCFCGAEVYRY